MQRDQLNRLMRFLIAFILAGAAILVVMAARPPARRIGIYTAEFGKPQPILGLWDEPAAFLTITHPMLLSLPPSWKLTDTICMVMQVTRGTAPTTTEFTDFQPQAQWDVKALDALVMDYDGIRSRAVDGSALKIDNPTVGAAVTAFTDYQVHWFGDPPILLLKDQTFGGLLCYHYYFNVNQLDLFHLPFSYLLSFQVRNVLLDSWPAYYFRYNAPSDASYPPQTFTLQRDTLDHYLSQLAIEAPFAVKKLTKAQIDQLGTEVPARK